MTQQKFFAASALLGLTLTLGLMPGAQAAKGFVPVGRVIPPVAVPGQVQVSDAWVRATVPGQAGTGAYLRLLSPQNATLVGVSSSVAGTTELHQMVMDGDVMRMSALASITLPAGEVVDLQPGGHHLMLMNLKAPLSSGDLVDLTLTFKNAKGVTYKQEVMVPVLSGAQVPQPVPVDMSEHMDKTPSKGH